MSSVISSHCGLLWDILCTAAGHLNRKGRKSTEQSGDSCLFILRCYVDGCMTFRTFFGMLDGPVDGYRTLRDILGMLSVWIARLLISSRCGLLWDILCSVHGCRTFESKRA
ncbi:hypothetical protein JTE90_001892 [Oedothorax gibbosus]|uniref:Uncharacterized protein n=1 Tax=Oedothorax gibbosus TaxID=931172 RepID=A0AAV6VP71_9ARAC|nr:hypothetical protein JTE90_001892 [Oedothorax gibbosus]